MADSASTKAQVVEENLKYSNMINRTTSESIRLSESDKISIHPTTLSASSSVPIKKTSFQITSVLEHRRSNDGGDDSADDLDESHAEDISDVIDISRTDLENETPSYSEDTFSKDDVFFNSSTSLGTAPVIPTSSQYGLAIVSTPEGCSNILNSNVSGGSNAVGNDLGLHVNVSENVINLGIVSGKHLEGDMRDLHNHASRNERFKVVKIESTEPFKRGRWMCMDYLDHTMSQQQQSQLQNQNTNAKVAEVNDLASINTGADSVVSTSENSNMVAAEEHSTSAADHSTNTGITNTSAAGQDQQNLISQSTALINSQNSVSPGQTMQFSTQGGGNIGHPSMNVSQQQSMAQQAQSMTAVSNQHTQLGTNQHQSLQPQQIQQVISAANIHNQPTSLNNQQIQQPIQQLQHQGISIQHVHQIHQPQTNANLVPQQQYQQPPPQIQQIHHQQPTLQSVQQNTQPLLQQQPSVTQHLQHQHNISMPVQQQINQGQIPGQVITNQTNMQQLSQQANQMHVLSQIQQFQQNLQHLQNVAGISPMSLSGVVSSAPQVIQAPSSQQQQYHIATSQSMVQQGVQSQPGLMPLQQTQYFPSSQIQNTTMSVPQPISSNAVLQGQAQNNPNVALPLQQNYSINSLNQQPSQQIPVGHAIPPTSIPLINQSQITTTSVPVIMSQSNPLPGLNNLSISATQNTVISPQVSSQGASLVQQQYVTQPIVVSSLAQTQTSGGPQIFDSSVTNTVPSLVESIALQGFPVELSADQTAHGFLSIQQTESLGEGTTTEEIQPEDAESASGASAVAIDNKIEQAMDLVKSHLMFAVREEVEVLKERIAELMDRITLLENENTLLKQNASQETLAALTSLQPSSSNAP